MRFKANNIFFWLKFVKTTIKTLRFYEKIGLFFPSKVGSNRYRYYETSKLLELSKIIALRQIDFTIEDIKQVLKGANFNQLLSNELKEIENLQKENIFKISRIKYLLGDKSMKYEVVEKILPEYIVYYKEGIL